MERIYQHHIDSTKKSVITQFVNYLEAKDTLHSKDVDFSSAYCVYQETHWFLANCIANYVAEIEIAEDEKVDVNAEIEYPFPFTFDKIIKYRKTAKEGNKDVIARKMKISFDLYDYCKSNVDFTESYLGEFSWLFLESCFV